MSSSIAFVVFFIIFQTLLTQGAWTGYEMPQKYFISQDRATFLQSFVNCKQGGMELASIETEEEQLILDDLLQNYKIYGSDNGLWISGIRTIQSSNSPFYWLSRGEKLVYTRWAAGQPDNYQGNEHCVHWTVYQTSEGMQTGWNDYHCNAKLKYICERK